MKRFDSAVLAMLLGIATLAVACGGSAPPSEPAAAPAAEQPQTPAAPPEPPAAAAEPAITAPTSDDSYAATMKMVSNSAQAVRRAVTENALADAGKDSRQLEQLFAGVGTFWEGRKTDDAVKFAKAASAAAAALTAAASANDAAKAAAAVKTLDTQCAGCHKAHRQQDGDYFSIK